MKAYLIVKEANLKTNPMLAPARLGHRWEDEGVSRLRQLP